VRDVVQDGRDAAERPRRHAGHHASPARRGVSRGLRDHAQRPVGEGDPGLGRVTKWHRRCPMPIRKAEAEWKGNLRDGRGELALESGAFRGPYTFKSRFEDGKETNPEELLGAAHAGCFTMALTAALGREKVTPTEVHTTASVHLEHTAGAFSITRIELRT